MCRDILHLYTGGHILRFFGRLRGGSTHLFHTREGFKGGNKVMKIVKVRILHIRTYIERTFDHNKFKTSVFFQKTSVLRQQG